MARRPKPSGFELLDSMVEQRARAVRGTLEQISVPVAPEMRSLLFRAAAERDIAMTAYARRAIVSFAAHDLGESYLSAMLHEPAVSDFAGTPYATRRRMGLGFGFWEIESMTGDM